MKKSEISKIFRISSAIDIIADVGICAYLFFIVVQIEPALNEGNEHADDGKKTFYAFPENFKHKYTLTFDHILRFLCDFQHVPHELNK